MRTSPVDYGWFRASLVWHVDLVVPTFTADLARSVLYPCYLLHTPVLACLFVPARVDIVSLSACPTGLARTVIVSALLIVLPHVRLADMI